MHEPYQALNARYHWGHLPGGWHLCAGMSQLGSLVVDYRLMVAGFCFGVLRASAQHRKPVE